MFLSFLLPNILSKKFQSNWDFGIKLLCCSFLLNGNSQVIENSWYLSSSLNGSLVNEHLFMGTWSGEQGFGEGLGSITQAFLSATH